MNFHFDGSVAEMYGVDGAVFISRLQFWIEKNAANDRHYHKGRYWTYNSLRAMEKLFPFWSRRQIERIVKNLKDKGVLLTANYARDSHDRTLFYALDESKLPISPFGGDLSPNGDTNLSRNGDNPSPNGEMINEQLKTHIREEEDKANKTEISNKLTIRPRSCKLTTATYFVYEGQRYDVLYWQPHYKRRDRMAFLKSSFSLPKKPARLKESFCSSRATSSNARPKQRYGHSALSSTPATTTSVSSAARCGLRQMLTP